MCRSSEDAKPVQWLLKRSVEFFVNAEADCWPIPLGILPKDLLERYGDA